MEYLIALVLGVIGSLLAAEVGAYHKRACSWIIGRAAHRIDVPETRAIYHEEWLAALNDQVGILASFGHALGCYFAAHAVAIASKRALATEKAAAQSSDRERSRRRRFDGVLSIPTESLIDIIKLLLLVVSHATRRANFVTSTMQAVENLRNRTRSYGTWFHATVWISVFGFYVCAFVWIWVFYKAIH